MMFNLTGALNYDPPLSFLFEEDGQGSDSAAIIYKLHTNENIQLVFKAFNVPIVDIFSNVRQ